MAGSPQPYVLYVDDDAIVRETFELFFQSVGWRYDIVADGRSGIDAALNNQYDVIITDLTMPGISGFDLLRQVRRHNPNQAVMVVTGLGTFDDVVKSLREGAIDFFEKPIDFKFLEEAVRRVQSAMIYPTPESQLVENLTYYRSDMNFPVREISSIDLPIPILNWLTDSGKIDVNTKLRILLAFQEALTNSVDHGCLELESEWKEDYDQTGLDRYTIVRKERLKDPAFCERRVEIVLIYDRGELQLTIRDEGKGFIKEDLRVVSKDADPATFGRGLVMMAGSMDEIHYTDRGRQVTMKVRLTDDGI